MSHSHIAVGSQRYGKPSVPRSQQPSMSDILSWNRNVGSERNLIVCEPIKMAPQQLEGQNMLQRTSSLDNTRKSLVKPIYSSVYVYDDDYQPYQQDSTHHKVNGSTKNLHQSRSDNRLSHLEVKPPKDQIDLKERKERIKKFKTLSRELPNSSFTTYYGKPAFEVYGRSNSGVGNKKTFNVMPHSGANKPLNAETHQSALLQAHKVPIKSHVPRKPIASDYIPKTKQETSTGVNLPLPTPPNLVNHVRFTTDPGHLTPAPLPVQLPIERIVTKRVANKQNKNQKNKAQKNAADVYFKPTGQGPIREILEKRKINSHRMPYKVTEYSPVPLEGFATSHRSPDFPAGKSSKRA